MYSPVAQCHRSKGGWTRRPTQYTKAVRDLERLSQPSAFLPVTARSGACTLTLPSDHSTFSSTSDFSLPIGERNSGLCAQSTFSVGLEVNFDCKLHENLP